MKLLAEGAKQGYCPLCGNKLPIEPYNSEMEDNVNYSYFSCGKCEATYIEEVYDSNENYKYSNAWKPMEY